MATCQQAGIRTVMITGDHKVTALAIARELGIYRPGNTVLSGDELDAMSEEDLDAAVGTTTVFSRVSPADKLRIIQSLKRTGEVTAMTGDGVNDSPALKAADIGVAMGVTGTDVAKDASDMILLDDSFTTIAYAIKEGRRVYRNIQKVIQFLLVGNIAEILTLFLATALNWEAPLLAVHILWVNLATATLPALALGVDPASKNIMKHPPVRSGTLFERDLVRRVVTQGIFVALLTTAAYWIGVRMADPHHRADHGLLRAGTVPDAAGLQPALQHRAHLGAGRRHQPLADRFLWRLRSAHGRDPLDSPSPECLPADHPFRPVLAGGPGALPALHSSGGSIQSHPTPGHLSAFCGPAAFEAAGPFPVHRRALPAGSVTQRQKSVKKRPILEPVVKNFFLLVSLFVNFLP